MVDSQLFAIIMYLQFFILVGPAVLGWAYFSWRDYRRAKHRAITRPPANLDEPAEDHLDRVA